ncbi:MAG: cyclic nucleotide-binding domain-containing protein [Deltaproteobacteria bacterium]|nr:cyclic nucleotide-binding domain-containing protein [Deltaproteobacteria bacterium]
MAGNAKKIAKLKAEAMAAAQGGKTKRALERYLELAEEDPDDPSWPQRAGDAARKLGDAALAIANYAASAEAYARQGFLIKAIALCKTILDIDPQHTETQGVLATLNQAQAKGRAQTAPFGVGIGAPPPSQPPPVRNPTPVAMPAATRAAPGVAPARPPTAPPVPVAPAQRAQPQAVPPPRAPSQPPPPRAQSQPPPSPPALAPEPERPAPPRQRSAPIELQPARDDGALELEATTQAALAEAEPEATAPPAVEVDLAALEDDADELAALMAEAEATVAAREASAPTASRAAAPVPESVRAQPQQPPQPPQPQQPPQRAQPPRPPQHQHGFPAPATPAPAAPLGSRPPPIGARSSGVTSLPLGSGPPPGPRSGGRTTASVTRSNTPQARRMAIPAPSPSSPSLEVPAPAPATSAAVAFDSLPPAVPSTSRSGRQRTTIPPGAPLAAVNLGTLMPGSRDATELTAEGGGATEISLDDDFSALLEEDVGGLAAGPPTEHAAPALDPDASIAAEPTADDAAATADAAAASRDSSAPAPPPRAARTAEAALPKTPLFSALDSASLQRMIETCQLLECAPGDTVFKQGDTGDRLYVVAHGEVVVTRMVQRTPDQGEVPPAIEVARMGEGSFFGEVGLLTDTPRSATVTALVDTTLLVIDRDVIGDLVEERPGVLKVLLEFLRERLIDELVDTAPLFAPFSGEERLLLARRFKFVEVEGGRTLIKQGERAPGLFVLLCGKVTVERDGALLAELVPGDLVGEMSLLARSAAVASVQTRSKSYLLALPAANFQEMIVTYPQFLIFVSDLAEERAKRMESGGGGGPDDYEDFHLDLL